MIKELAQAVKDKVQAAKKARDCAKGRHRWAHITEKLGEGKVKTWRVCQDCGVEDGAA